jgi:RNA polymerase sigma-70 factor, ECF subfamily
MDSTPVTTMSGEITSLLRDHHAGNRAALDHVIPMLYGQLCAIARRQLSRLPRGDSMDTSGLITETYLKLVDEIGVDWKNRGHFIAICARTMRRILVDAARYRYSIKRDSGTPSSVDIEDLGRDEQYEKVLAVDQALEQLAQLNERMAKVVECRFFAGMTEEETALALAVPLRAVQRDWLRARIWLQKQLS